MVKVFNPEKIACRGGWTIHCYQAGSFVRLLVEDSEAVARTYSLGGKRAVIRFLTSALAQLTGKRVVLEDRDA